MPSPERDTKPKHEPSLDALRVGDRVAYSVAFLQSIGAVTGDMPHARGIITDLVPLGETTLAEVAWDRDGVPPA